MPAIITVEKLLPPHSLGIELYGLWVHYCQIVGCAVTKRDKKVTQRSLANCFAPPWRYTTLHIETMYFFNLMWELGRLTKYPWRATVSLLICYDLRVRILWSTDSELVFFQLRNIRSVQTVDLLTQWNMSKKYTLISNRPCSFIIHGWCLS